MGNITNALKMNATTKQVKSVTNTDYLTPEEAVEFRLVEKKAWLAFEEVKRLEIREYLGEDISEDMAKAKTASAEAIHELSDLIGEVNGCKLIMSESTFNLLTATAVKVKKVSVGDLAKWENQVKTIKKEMMAPNNKMTDEYLAYLSELTDSLEKAEAMVKELRTRPGYAKTEWKALTFPQFQKELEKVLGLLVTKQSLASHEELEAERKRIKKERKARKKARKEAAKKEKK